ncbi:MAG: DUF2817 domain-containing protein [Bacteroidales bacterium]|nr:DUF2817 domain-containing protein [Bacteroidales bacterium]
MRKFIRIFLYSVLGIVDAMRVSFYIAYRYIFPGTRDVEVNQANLAYFQENYDDARSEFLSHAKDLADKYENVRLFKYKVESKTDANLIMDLCYIPAQQNTRRLLIITSGLHGIEGYTGSAIQQMFMKEFLSDHEVQNQGILLIHSINPYGFKYMRKATENNVDLNRNCSVSKAIFENKNKGYAELYNLLCPSGKVNKGSLSNRLFYFVAIRKILQKSMATLRQAALQGQYKFPEGIYYGGNDFEPQIYYLQEVLPEIFVPYDLILTLDMHTAYGAWGKLHLFTNPLEDDILREKTESLFNNHPVDWGNAKDFYTILGDFSGFLGMLNPDTTCLSMKFEFGTLDSQKTFGSLHSIHRMILENQGHLHGYKNEKFEKNTKNDYREMYYPTSEAWRSEVIRQARDMMKTVLENYR